MADKRNRSSNSSCNSFIHTSKVARLMNSTLEEPFGLESDTMESDLNVAQLKSQDIELPALTQLEDKSEREVLELIARSVAILPAIKEDLATLNFTHTANASQVSELFEENQALKLRMSVLEGKNKKIEYEFTKLKKVVVDMQTQQMRENVLIHGITESPRENCLKVVREFLKTTLKIPVTENIDIDVAHRSGQKSTNRHRQIVVKLCNRRSKLAIFKFVKNLKGTQFSVVDQLPNETRERRIAQVPTWKKLKNEGKTCKFVADRLSVEGELQKTDFTKNPASAVTNTNFLSIQKFSISDEIIDRGSKFKAYATTVTDIESVSTALNSLYQEPDFATADHRIYTYSIGDDHGWDDDAEYGAGKKLYTNTKEKEYDNYFVCVTRRFGGTYLGNDRFEHITTCALDALDRL